MPFITVTNTWRRKKICVMCARSVCRGGQDGSNYIGEIRKIFRTHKNKKELSYTIKCCYNIIIIGEDIHSIGFFFFYLTQFHWSNATNKQSTHIINTSFRCRKKKKQEYDKITNGRVNKPANRVILRITTHAECRPSQ